jgi:hypothetical protein
MVMQHGILLPGRGVGARHLSRCYCIFGSKFGVGLSLHEARAAVCCSCWKWAVALALM